MELKFPVVWRYHCSRADVTIYGTFLGLIISIFIVCFRSWFHFGVKGGGVGRVVKFTIMNMNRQGKLYNQGYSPVVKVVPGRPTWQRIRDRPTYEVWMDLPF